MRTAGLLLMDTPMPDGRIYIPPTAMTGGGAIATSSGLVTLDITGALVNINAQPALLMRYGMSDDAQANFGMGAPGSLGLQGAQAQVVTTGQPFTTPYGPSGRPPQPSSNFGKPTVSRPKGLKPTAVTVAYTVTGGPLTSLQVLINKFALNVGVAPVAVPLLAPANLPLATAQTNLVTIPIPVANQQWLADPFDILDVILAANAGAATLHLYGMYVDTAFNYN